MRDLKCLYACCVCVCVCVCVHQLVLQGRLCGLLAGVYVSSVGMKDSAYIRASVYVGMFQDRWVILFRSNA